MKESMPCFDIMQGQRLMDQKEIRSVEVKPTNDHEHAKKQKKRYENVKKQLQLHFEALI